MQIKKIISNQGILTFLVYDTISTQEDILSTICGTKNGVLYLNEGYLEVKNLFLLFNPYYSDPSKI